MRKVARRVPGAAGAIARVARLDYSKPGKPDIDSDDAAAKQLLVSDLELLDAQALVGELVAEGSVFAFLAENRHELFPDSFITDLFCSSTGRPSLPADLIGSVGAGAQGTFRPVGPADRGGGALRHPLEGGVRASVDADLV